MTTITDHTQPIEFFLEHAAEIVDRLAEDDRPIVLTVAGQPKAVLVDIEEFREYKEYKERQKGEALLKILNDRYDRAERDGTFIPVDEAFQRIREKIMARKPS